jgi:RNA polymerase sigma-70 factor, ECF subfamily
MALSGALAGDEQAFRVLYRGIQPGLLRYLRSLVGSDAEDVAAETWLQICRDLSTFRGDIAGLRSWCATVARHRAMDHLRRLRRRPETTYSDDALAELADLADTWTSAAHAIATDRAVALISSLPRAQAEAVFLRVVIGLDVAGAAKVLGNGPGRCGPPPTEGCGSSPTSWSDATSDLWCANESDCRRARPNDLDRDQSVDTPPPPCSPRSTRRARPVRPATCGRWARTRSHAQTG